MAKENAEQTLREYGNRKKRYKRRIRIIIISLLLIIAAVGVSFLIYLYNRTYQNYKAIKSTEIEGENVTGYLSYGSSIIRYGKNGAIAYDKDGKLLWNGSFEMSAPIADTCGKYVVFADKGNKSVHIFDEDGAAGDFKTLYNIVKVEVASQGVVAALMEEGNNNYIVLYDLDGKELAPISNTVNNAGFPLDIAYSDDGKKLIVIYLKVTGGEPISNVACYAFTEYGKNFPSQMVGAYKAKNGIMAPRVIFLNNNNFCVYKDNGFALYSFKEKTKEVKDKSLKGKVLSILSNKKYTGLVLEAVDGSSKHLMLYDLKGKKVLDKTLDFDYKQIFLADEEIIMYNDLNCKILKINGKTKFKHTFDSNIAGFYPSNNLDRYFLVNETKLSTIQLTE